MLNRTLLLASSCFIERAMGSGLVMLTASACSGNDAVWLSEPGFEEYRAWAEENAPGSGLYLVEWDLVLDSDAALRLHYEERRTALESAQLSEEDENESGVVSKLAAIRQLSTGAQATFGPDAALDLDYCVSNSFANRATVLADLRTAMGQWESVANVRFLHDTTQDASCSPSNGAVDFAVLPISGQSLAGCGANKLMWPGSLFSWGCTVNGTDYVNGVLLMDFSAFPPSSPNHGVTKVGLLRHELGHVLGFRHEHPFAPNQGNCGEDPDDTFADLTAHQLTAYDQLSVMHYPGCNGLPGMDMTLSELDGVGARAAYGMPTAWWSASITAW